MANVFRGPPRFVEKPGLRALSTGERRNVLRRLRKRWPQPDKDYWHPLTAFLSDPSALRLETKWLLPAVPDDEFRRCAALRWSKFWVIGEGTPTWDDVGHSYQGEFEISSRFASPVLSSETIVVPTSLEWFAYTDHNDSVCLVGEWLTEVVKDLWPTWEQHVWTTAFYDGPPDAPADYRPWWEAQP
jgi:hypothetical protein